MNDESRIFCIYLLFRSPQEPISRKRITAPTTARPRDEDESDRKYFAASNTSGSAKSRLGIKQRISY